MKRIFIAFLLAVVLAFCTIMNAAAIQVNGLNETRLYELYSQVESQIQLNKLIDADSYSSSFNYDDIERNPSNHKGEKIYFEGKVVQVLEGKSSTEYRITAGRKSSDVFLVSYIRPTDSERFLTDDSVCVYAEFIDLETYNSTTNKSVTVPFCKAALIIRPISNKNVSSAEDTELEETLTAIKERLATVVAKDGDYSKVTKINFDDFARHEKLHTDELITVSGKVLQVVEGSSRNMIRLAVDSDSDRVFYLTVDPKLSDIRVLEDDKITIKGKYTGLYTYSSTLGGEITIPSASVDTVKVQGYTIPQKFQTDQDGNYKLSKKLFEDYSRRPNEHLEENITFSAKVLQVIEGNSSSQYRMAVDNDSNYVMFVTIANKDRVMRILEDDKVTVTAIFKGLLTYESTMGTSITIPQCTATNIVVPGKAATVAQKDKDGVIKVTKKNYESLARDEEMYKDEPLKFMAKVVQAVEGDSITIYRLAVDKDSNAMFYATISNSDLDIRILEDDIVNVEGKSTGLYSYKSARGGKITIPSCAITGYTVEGYKKQDLGSKDGSGFYTITKKNYEEIARNPTPYKGEGITFKGKVLQVVERSGANVYRIAVDSDSNKVFYVEYDQPAGASRILEKDIVTLQGEFFGIYTYSTTLGSSVSVPAVIASDIRK